MTRLRYKASSTVPNMLVSGDVPTADGMVHVQLFTDSTPVQFRVVNSVTSQVVTNGTASTTHRVKILAKQALVTLGVTFGAEKRVHVKGEVDFDLTTRKVVND